jgi:hypothetical protein
LRIKKEIKYLKKLLFEVVQREVKKDSDIVFR